MRLILPWFGYEGIKFCNVAIGDVTPLAQIKLNKRFRGIRLSGTFYLEWEKSCIRLRWVDKIKFMSEFRLSSQAVEELEKMLYWEYAKIVRDYIYDSEISPFDYSKIFGYNLYILRSSAGMGITEAADVLKINPCQLVKYEAGIADIELELKRKKEDSMIFQAADFYSISIFDIFSIGLFYHKPVKNIKICNEKMKNTLRTYHAGRLSNM